MATWSYSGTYLTGSQTKRATKSTRVGPELITARVDFSKINGTTGVSSSDLINVMYLPLQSRVDYITAEVVTAPTTISGTGTITVSANGINWVSGAQISGTGILKLDAAVLSNGTIVKGIVTSATSVSVVINMKTLGANMSDGVINVYAYVHPMWQNS